MEFAEKQSLVQLEDKFNEYLIEADRWLEECNYRCEVCEGDQCFCEDGLNRRLAHKNDCKSCQRMDELFFGSYVQHY